MTKQGKAAIIRMAQEGFTDLGVPSNRLHIVINDVNVKGSPPHDIDLYATIFFLRGGAPFCCGERGCYASVLRSPEEMADYLRKKMGLTQTVTVCYFIRPEYYDGIEFTSVEKAHENGHASGS